MATAFTSPVASLPSRATEVTPLMTQEEEEEELSVLLGSLQSSIVGIQYYAGTAHPGEFVQFVREPQNPYDRNAIRVDNMANVKVGHIKRQVAVALAPIMDRLKVKIDGTIPSIGNDYVLPVRIEIFGKDRAMQMQVDKIFKLHRNRWNMNKALAKQTSKPGAVPIVQVSKKSMDWQSSQKNLDDMFEKLSKDQLSNLPDILMPEALTQELFDHQVQGIRWLYQRETGNEQIPFYKQVKERGQNVWFSEITNSSQQTTPQPVKGAILSDDMGLGKTLQAIGLMLANPPKPGSKNKTTLILCPVSVMPNWFQQIEHHVKPDTLKVAMYHGPSRYDLLSKLDEIDVLVASYGTISTDYGNEFPKEGNENKPQKKKRKKAHASIFEEMFHRIILDEAHIIRNTKSRTFNGCVTLQSTYRLCLTGTPLQNKPEDIHSLFHFLSVEPLGDKDIFRRAVSQPIQNGDDVGLARLRTMMAHIALRRNKSMVNLKMAKKTVELRSIEFPEGSQHKEIHDALFKSAQIAFRATLGAGDDKALKNYMMILETLTRIRQACVSGVLVPKERMEAAERVLAEMEGKKEALTPEEGEALLQKLKGAFDDTEAVECAVCLNEMEECAAVILKTCSHVFCEPCLSKVSTTCRGLCPLCRQKFEHQDMIKKSAATAATTAEIGGIPLSQCMDELGPSPKLVALLHAMSEMKADEKAVLFSQFTKFLDLVEPFLTFHGYSFVRIDGSKTANQRIAAMNAFKEDGGPRVILCSLHAAGTGITLNRANHCFMMDTWWNRSVENQAQDRIHRIGQTRDVRVIRFVMKNSIEERMIAIQEAKAAIGKGAMEKLKPEEIRKTRIGDLKSLFSIKEETA